ncbi:MAG TPA: DUF3634 family protein [Polyangiaceae bacterium]|nr:DUF3634 family protein [Polyangiaceae bacterium]
MVVVFLVAAALLLAWGFRRSARLFVVELKDGRIGSAKGHLPPRLLSELEDVLVRARLSEVRLEGLPRGGAPTFVSRPALPPGVQQQLRNVLGQFTLTQIRSAPPR